ncbi:hypothetical protein PSU4_23740 [Pseudonocardia sulfidoxydans NBRC 16205]|uniref:Uncharacterized protein n=1 Tax=Pseudonocardia sulfidoxydans NBRC 16205 TaxID=1223511 RepID=A0A511DF55_9PSEU|nr:hypothetical protein [Pseudonocardia sulfidoxydans]GEL23420.1 hypothetical protein PSU4_23740 [Pseudonocardia sulfidoxydans NBRC 16205]
MSIDNCDLRLWRPAAPGTRPGSPHRALRRDDDRPTAPDAALDDRADGPEPVVAQR